MEDARNVLLEEKPFSYKFSSEEKAFVYFHGKQIFVAVKKDYKKLLQAIQLNDEYQIQLALAKMTGNFKHGNEKK